MTTDEYRSFLREAAVLVVATNGVTGHPHLVPMWFVMRDDEPWFWTYAKSQKTRNLERDGRISCLSEDGDVYELLRGVQLSGTAELHRNYEDVVAVGLSLAEKYRGGVLDAGHRRSIEHQASKRVAVRVAIEKVVSWDHRRLPAAD